jgi:hypothetical protein
MADRVLAGEMPHKDFDEIYSGGLTYLHALSFKLAGTNLMSMRYVLLAFVLIWVPAVYALARRFASPLTAGAVTLLALVWSVPNYFASLPSWYNLFFATFGSLCLFRHIEAPRSRWLFLAGLFGGLSFLVKMVGLYYIAAALLFLLYRETFIARSDSSESRSGPSLLLLKSAACLAFAGFLVFLLRSRPYPREIVHFAVPGLAICGLLIWNEARNARGSPASRIQSLARLMIPFGIGVVLPIAVFLFPYVRLGVVGDFFRGVFLLPQKRLASAARELPRLDTMVAVLPYTILLTYPFRGVARGRERLAAVAAAVFLGILLVWSKHPEIYYDVWNSARSLAVVAVLVSSLFLVLPDPGESMTAEIRQKIYLLACMTALVGLVQFPFAAPIYYCFVAPLVALTLLATVQARRAAPKLLHGCILGFYLLFAALRMNPSYVFNLGLRYRAYEASGKLRMDRGGLRVPLADELEYEQLLRLVRRYARAGNIYAAPDCPEVYFLSGLRNPTRAIFESLGHSEEPDSYGLALLGVARVEVVVLNRRPSFTSSVGSRFRSLLQERFAHSAEVGRFLVRWSE